MTTLTLSANNWLETSSNASEAWAHLIRPPYVVTAPPFENVTGTGSLDQNLQTDISDLSQVWSKMEEVLAKGNAQTPSTDVNLDPSMSVKVSVKVRSLKQAEFRMIEDEDVDYNQFDEW